MEKQAALTLFAIICAAACYSFVAHKQGYINTGNGEVYKFVGFAAQNINGDQIYMPVYRRDTK